MLYAAACSAQEPLHVRDLIRNAERDYGAYLDPATAIATIAPDPRFCWAGKGVYGLYRHGPLPGPRNLEEAARLILVAAGRPLNYQVVDFCLKRLRYRYNVDSLRNAVARSWDISWDGYGQWDHARGDAAERKLRAEIPVVPPRSRAAWIVLRDAAGDKVRAAIKDREARLAALADPSRFGLNWEA